MFIFKHNKAKQLIKQLDPRLSVEHKHFFLMLK